MPEITVRSILLGIILAILLGAANAYLGLKAGMTVSASIPAAVVSMAVLRLLRRSNILENNLVQTAASAGESLAAGVLFTMPALVLMGAWKSFHYGKTALIAAVGGLLGVVFTVPLRRALVVDSDLAFPEGVATARVLRAGQNQSGGLFCLAGGAVLGALFKVGGSGMGIYGAAVEGAGRAGGTVLYAAVGTSPALLAVGYIVRLNIAVLVFLGGALNWFVAIPILAFHQGVPAEAVAADFAWGLWSGTTRHIGVGAMLVGGLWALVRLWPKLIRLRLGAGPDTGTRPTTDRDAPLRWMLPMALLFVVPLYFIFVEVTGRPVVALVMAVVMLIAGFLFSAVASYMAGLVGSSNNPISGVTIATLLLSALLLLALGLGESTGPAAAILIGAVVCCAAAIGGDNIQDLKTGHLVGATPWKQQIMQAIGVVAAALVIAPVMQLLHDAYKIGSSELSAPQSLLMLSIAKGVFARDLPWTMVGIGAAIAVGVILIDLILEQRGGTFRMPVLAVAVGIYLPLELGAAILLGGILSWWSGQRGAPTQSDDDSGTGLLLACGLITGEALIGILLAAVIVLSEGDNPLKLPYDSLPLVWPGALWLVIVMGSLYLAGRRRG